MNLFLDNDVLEKLASWDLLDDGVRACGFGLDSVRVLPSLKFRLGLAGKKKGRPKYPEDILARLQSFLTAVGECTEAPPTDDDALVNVSNLDAGEAILFVQAASTDGAILLTGDKRSIQAVATAPECAEIANRLAGRVLCLEQVVLRIVDTLGFETVKLRIVNSSALELDTAIHAAFGSRMQAMEHNACGGLERRVQTLADTTGNLLASQRYRFADGPST